MLRLPPLKQTCLARRPSSPTTCFVSRVQRSPKVLSFLRTQHARAVEAVEDLPEEAQDFGQYSVILPPEPFAFGVSHIRPRNVPGDIIKPSYVRNNGSEHLESVNKPESIIRLGGEAESRLRRTARLAKQVREFAGSLVKAS